MISCYGAGSQTLRHTGNGEAVARSSRKRPDVFIKPQMKDVLPIKVLFFMCFSAVVYWLLTTSSWAYQGVDLGRDCRSGDDAPRARCEGFISGFLAGAQIDVDGEPITMWRYHGYTWCGPTVFDIPEIVDTLFEAARTGRATPHFPAPVMLAQSLSQKFPCEGLLMPRYPGLGRPLEQDQ